MRVRTALLRLLAVACMLSVVFFAAFFIAISMRNPGGQSRAAGPPAALAQADNAPAGGEPAVEVLDAVSTNPDAVPTTAPTTTTPPETAPLATATPEPRPALPQLDPLFDSTRTELVEILTIPVRLPGELDDEATNWAPMISAIDPNGYVIHLDRNEDCDGSSTCRVSTFTARRSAQLSPELTGGTPVPLPNGLSGVLMDSSCGEGCNNGFIIWIEDGVRYSVGSRVSAGPEILDLAWRSIDAALPTPSGPSVCGQGAPKHDGQVARTITTTVDDDRSMHWVAVCSELGFNIEIIDAPGELRWQDVDADGIHDAVVRYEDGSSTVFTIDNNRPRSVINFNSGRRLLVADLACQQTASGRRAVDRATGERLEFMSTTLVRRIADDTLTDSNLVDC